MEVIEQKTVVVESIVKQQWYRVGACPALEVVVTYPHLYASEERISAVDAARFNEAYARMAEALLCWASGEPARAATEAFSAMGSGAAYRFDRHLILCNMTASILHGTRPEGVEFLRVTRWMFWGGKKGGADENSVVHEDIWRLPSLTLTRRRPRFLSSCREDGGRM